jgi:hypothetical protein
MAYKFSGGIRHTIPALKFVSQTEPSPVRMLSPPSPIHCRTTALLFVSMARDRDSHERHPHRVKSKRDLAAVSWQAGTNAATSFPVPVSTRETVPSPSSAHSG